MIPEIKTPRDKLLETLNAMDERQYGVSFIGILMMHINRNPNDFDAEHLLAIITRLQNTLSSKVANLELVVDISEERAKYLKAFLEGKMYTSEEAAREALPRQINHAQEIIDACEKRWKLWG